MDPNLFHIDYERLFEVLVGIVIFSFLLERALSVLFESRFFIERTQGNPAKAAYIDEQGNSIPEQPETPKKKGVKEFIALAVCIAFCCYWDFDAITIILVSDSHVTVWGEVLTGAVIAGGSKASVTLFRDILGFMSNAEKERQTLLKEKREIESRQFKNRNL